MPPRPTGRGMQRKRQIMDKLIETIVEAIDDKKGQNIVSLDLTGFDGAICSHFVVCNADSTTQVAAIAAGIGGRASGRAAVESRGTAECFLDRHGLYGRDSPHIPDGAPRLLPPRRVMGRCSPETLPERTITSLRDSFVRSTDNKQAEIIWQTTRTIAP